MSDVLDLARGIRIPTFGQPAETLGTATAAQCDTPAPYYLRMELLDAQDRLPPLQRHWDNASVDPPHAPIRSRRRQCTCLIVTHATSQSALTTALADLHLMMSLLAPRRIAY